MGVSKYIMEHDAMLGEMAKLGFPGWLILFFIVTKPLGLLAIWINKSRILREWAYAGFLFVFVLATISHINVGDGNYPAPIVAGVLLLVSYYFGCSCCNKEKC